MSWLPYALLCALLLSGSSLYEKKVLKKVHSIDFFATLSILNFIFSIPFLILIRPQEIHGFDLLLIFISALLAAIAFFLVTKGVRHLEVSTVSPLLALSPGSTAVLAFFVLGERLSTQHILGIACMIIGSYILATQHQSTILDPLKRFRQSKYVHYVLISLLFYSVAAIFDRAIVHTLSVSVPIYLLFINFFIMALSLPIESLYGVGIKGIQDGFRVGGMDLILVSLLSVSSTFFEMKSLQLISVGLVSTIKRSSAFFTTLIGGEMFHEHNLERKFFSALIIVIGAILIAL